MFRLRDHKSKKPYDKGNILKAFEATKSGVSVYRASRLYGVPESTLRDRTRGFVAPDCNRSGPDTLLSSAEEEQLMEHINYMANIGYGYSKSDIQFMAADYARSVGKKKSNDDKPLSHNWFYGFLKRWPELKLVKPQKLNISRAENASQNTIDKYFSELSDVMKATGVEPCRIFNVDETGVNTEHCPPKIVCSKTSNPQAVTSSRSANISIIGAASAVGTFVPPFYVFPGKRWIDDLLHGAPPGSAGTVTDKGWSNTRVFEHYMQSHFAKHALLGDTSDQPPTLVLFDGHKSHVGLTLANWARQRNVTLFVLPPHTSHLTQPLDVGVFGPFKKFYYTECHAYLRQNPGISITRYEVAQLTAKPFLKAFSPENITSAFEKSGIFPFHSQKILPSQVAPATIYNASPVCTPECNVDKSSSNELDKHNSEACNVSPASFFDKRSITNVVQKPKKKKFVPPFRVTGNLTSQSTYELLIEQSKQKVTEKKCSGNKSAAKSILHVLESPRPSTSKSNVTNMHKASPQLSQSSLCDSVTDNELCCVCKRFEPVQLKDCVNIVFVKWGKCDFCEHWTHLFFCSKVRVLRRDSIFRCPHCSLEE